MKDNLKSAKLENKFHRLLLQSLSTLKDPFWKKINITRVKITVNGQKCEIFYTYFGFSNKDNINKNLLDKGSVLKKLISKKWNHRLFPSLVFIYDQSLTNAETIHRILKNLNSDEKQD